jgi:hypothetical protein
MAAPISKIPDVRDGLTRAERVVLWCLRELSHPDEVRSVPTAMLYGAVIEHIDISQAELMAIIRKLGA